MTPANTHPGCSRTGDKRESVQLVFSMVSLFYYSIERIEKDESNHPGGNSLPLSEVAHIRFGPLGITTRLSAHQRDERFLPSPNQRQVDKSLSLDQVRRRVVALLA